MYGRGGGRASAQYSNSRYEDMNNDRQDRSQQFPHAQSTANEYGRRSSPSRDNFDRRAPPSSSALAATRRAPPSSSALAATNRDVTYDRRPPPGSNDLQLRQSSVNRDVVYERDDRTRRFNETLNTPDYRDFGRSNDARGAHPASDRLERPPPRNNPYSLNTEFSNDVRQTRNNSPPRTIHAESPNERNEDFGGRSPNGPPPARSGFSQPPVRGAMHSSAGSGPPPRSPYDTSDNNRFSRDSRPNNFERSGYDSAAPQRGGYGNDERSGRPDPERFDGGRDGYASQRPARNEMEDRDRGGYSRNSEPTRGAPPARGGYADRGGYSLRDQDNVRPPPPPTRNGYGAAVRDDGPASRGRDNYGRDAPDSRLSYNDRPTRGAMNGGGYGSTRGGAMPGSYDRDDSRQTGYDRDEPSRPTRGGSNNGGYGESRPTRGGSNNGGYGESRPSRGGAMGAGGGYDRASNNGDRYSDQQENGYGRPQPPSTRGGRPAPYESRSYNDQRDSSNDYGNRRRDDSYSNGNNDRSGYGPSNPRGGYGGFTRGTFSSDRGGSSRYEDRRNENTGYGGFNSANNGGYSGYSGFSGGNQFNDDGRKIRTAENHAPRDYKPVERDIDDIFEEDKEDIKKNTATLFDEDADVKVEEANEEIHCDTWNDMNLHQSLMENIKRSDYIKPRKIQQKTIPFVLEGYDVECQGETGSGKTAAFLIPVIQKMIEQNEQAELSRDGPICLIVAPTRELVTQIYHQAQRFTYNTGITVARAYGEYNMHLNRSDIRKGCNILCACIGRLMHFIEEGDVKLDFVKFLILDEADRMLMDRNNSDILKLFNSPDLPDKQNFQMLLFSATLRDPIVMDLTQSYMKPDKCVMITATCQSNKRVIYKIYAVPSAPAKFKYLVKYMKQITEENGGEVPRTLIFVNKKVNTDRVAIECTTNGFPATTIHGDRGQHLREEALNSFRSGKTRCLVATDVCARGVDIKEMDHVINFDLPTDKDGFIQRSGRTGRTHKGYAMSFYYENDDKSMATEIARIISQNGQESPAFLDSYVQESDYNFGQIQDESAPAAEVNGYQNNDNGYGSGNGNNDHEWDDPPACESHPQQQRESTNQNGAAEAPQQSSTSVIPDATADDEWD